LVEDQQAIGDDERGDQDLHRLTAQREQQHLRTFAEENVQGFFSGARRTMCITNALPGSRLDPRPDLSH
jgi:hypothetical protein